MLLHSVSGVWEMSSSLWSIQGTAGWAGRWFHSLPLGMECEPREAGLRHRAGTGDLRGDPWLLATLAPVLATHQG